jgi:hypothetical protein
MPFFNILKPLKLLHHEVHEGEKPVMRTSHVDRSGSKARSPISPSIFGKLGVSSRVRKEGCGDVQLHHTGTKSYIFFTWPYSDKAFKYIKGHLCCLFPGKTGRPSDPPPREVMAEAGAGGYLLE